jgi:sirohydrochlorin ferrochelatase
MASVSLQVLLMDNGSLEPASTRQLRGIAAALAKRVALPVTVSPVSLAHADKIPVEKLGGRPAELFEAALDRRLRDGVREFVIVPQFVGPSHVLTRHVPALIAERRKEFPGLRATVTPPLFEPGESRLGEILAEHVREQLGPGERPRVAVVDHGSPAQAVAEVRDLVTAQVRASLGDAVGEVAACSMERRPGTAFEFNEPLIADLLARPEWRSGPLVVAMLFIAPGRHAGPEGDVARMVRAARGGTESGMEGVRFTRLLGQHSRIVEILADRVRTAMAA